MPPASLGDFVQAAQARALYRAFLRAARAAPGGAAADLRDAVRREFGARRSALRDAAKFALADGAVQLKRLRESLGMVV